MAFYSDPRETIMPIVAALVVTVARNFLQYHRYSYGSIGEFLGTWFVHYIAICLTIGIAFALSRAFGGFFVGRSKNLRQLALEDAMVFGSILTIAASLMIFAVAHWPRDLETDLN